MTYTIKYIAETDSTNHWLKAYGSEGIVVWADYQTAGRGCGTNTWESERGKNLLFSVLLHPDTIPARRQFHLSMAVSVALYEVLSAYADGFSIKWPNDIYWNDHKICGMLIENRVAGQVLAESIIGIGLNVNQRVFLSDAPNPVSLCQIVEHDIDRQALLNDILQKLDEVITRSPCSEVSSHNSLLAAYEERLYRRGENHAYTDHHGPFKATLTGVLDDGHLRLIDESGTERTYAFKEIQFTL